jgi:uncharacterized protein (TIGR01244 family)
MVTRNTALFFTVILVAAIGFGDCGADGAPPAMPKKVENVVGVARDNLYLDGRVYISGQPDEAAFEELARRGVAVVINARTPGEMEDPEELQFDEEAVVRELGMSYVWIPLGGDDHPYEPTAVDKLDDALSSSDGPVLIHCLYGGRAAYLWVAHLVREQEASLEDAMARGEAMMLRPHPVGRLLDRPTKLVFTDSGG